MCLLCCLSTRLSIRQNLRIFIGVQLRQLGVRRERRTQFYALRRVGEIGLTSPENYAE